METPAFDVTSGAQRKNQFMPGEGWDIWRTEVAVLNRLAGSRRAQAKAIEKDVGVKADSDSDKSQSVDGLEEESAEFEKWTQEIREVVQRVSGAAKKKDQGEKEKAKKPSRRKAKKGEEDEDDEDEDGDESCDEGHSDNP